MSKAARYYMSRIHKMGQMNVGEAIRRLPQIGRGMFNYTFIDVYPEEDTGARFTYAKLAKYRSSGSVGVVNAETHRMEDENVDNLLESFSDFIYIPEYSAIAHRHVWNQINREQFPVLFSSICKEAYQGFMAECHLEPIVDLRTFVKRISKLDSVNALHARVTPPNPLFGPLWADLKEYLKARKINEMTVAEKSDDDGISTNIVQVVNQISSANPPGNADALGRARELMGMRMGAIGDTALLMAADGYGRATVEGREDGQKIVIKTADNQINFTTNQDATPEEVYSAAHAELSTMNKERGLGH